MYNCMIKDSINLHGIKDLIDAKVFRRTKVTSLVYVEFLSSVTRPGD